MKKNNNKSNLTLREKRVLLALEEKPLATYDELASMTHLAKSVVYGIIKKMEGEFNPYFSVKGIPHLYNLGLELLDVLVKTSQKKLKFIKKLGDEHPYITFYNRTYGDVNGMFIQLKVPIGSLNSIQNLFQKLKNKEYIDDFTLLQFSSAPIYSRIKVNAWDPETLSWHFSWSDWFKNKSYSKSSNTNQSKKEFEVYGKAKSWLKQLDIAIIGELYYNARRKNSDMIERLKIRGWKIPESSFSRRLKMVKDECIEAHRVFMNPKAFDILNSFLIWGYGDEQELQNIKTRMQEASIPFTSTLKIDHCKLYWYLHLPTSHMSDLLFYLSPKLPELHFNYIDYPRTQTFLLNTEAWDEEEKDWRTDEKYCFISVLQKLEELESP